MYSMGIIKSQPVRLILTIGAVALCIILMLFLLGIYKGVADGSVEYIRKNNADLWVLQKNCTNILRGTSLLSTWQGKVIGENPDVETVSPVLFLLSSVKGKNGYSTVFLTGYKPENKFGGPPDLVTGRNIKNGNEIVLDEAYALKSGFKINDSLCIQDEYFRIVGLSKGTNAFVIQYAFTTISKTRSLIGFPGLTTCYIIKLKPNVNIQKVKKNLLNNLPGTVIYTQQEFLKNNIKEMESGFLPILYAVASLGAIVLTVILSLILSMSILEKKKDFAVMKTLGAQSGFLSSLVIKQALLIIFAAGVTALLFYFPVVAGIQKLSPEVSTENTILQIVFVMLVAVLMGLISSFVAIQRLRKIYALEVFYERR
jgi:putative ABC transport system permease protein